MRLADGAVWVEDSVPCHRELTGEVLMARFLEGIGEVTLGVIHVYYSSLYLGPIELIRLGKPQVSDHAVSWVIEGGRLAASAAGYFTIEWASGALTASLHGYRPALPRIVYDLTQLQLHHALLHVQLLRMAQDEPPAPRADPARRVAAGVIDTVLCAGLALATARRNRLAAFAGVTVAYHLACWKLSGRTVGGVAMGQRVVSRDGSGLTLLQAVLRFAALPLSALRLRDVHDELSATAVVQD